MRSSNLLKNISHLLQAWVSVSAETLIGLKQRAYGIDLSRYQGTFDPAAAVPGLLDFGIVKATEGTTYTYPEFEMYYSGVRQLMAQGAYHYLKSNVNGIAQADYFLQRIAGKQFQMLVIDFEGYSNTLNDAFVQVLYDSLVHVSASMPNCKTLLYTSPNLYDTVIYPAALRIWGGDVFTDWDLWIAQYPYVVNVDGEPVMPKNRKDWKIWQFSSVGVPAEHGTQYRVDRNVFNGSVSALKDWLQITTPPNTGETMTKYTATAITDGTRLRPDHNVNQTYIGSYPTGTKFNGDVLFIATAPTVVNQAVGDTWLQVTDINGVPKTGWVAIIHLGKPVCTLVENVITPPPVVTLPDMQVVLGDDVTYAKQTVILKALK